MQRSIMEGRNITPNRTEQEQTAAGLDGEVMQNVQRMVDTYSGRSDAELMQELKNSKNQGIISDAELSSVAEKISPMLNDQQLARLNSILQQLR